MRFKDDFFQAFIENGTVSQPRRESPAIEDYIGTVQFSERRTSLARDFILAIMPQLEWYVVPKNTKQLTFSQLFQDCCLQAQQSNIISNPLIPIKKAPIRDLLPRALPASSVPVPTTLAEFFRLFVAPLTQAADIPRPQPKVE